jgi:phospholipase C
MDGFVTEYVKSGAVDPSDAMGYYTRAQLPVTYALADGYVICNRWFASVMGPTFPNRWHLHLATSNGVKSNTVTSGPSIYDVLTTAGISSGYYSGGLPFPASYGKFGGNSNIAKFFTDAQAGTLPAFSFVDPTFSTLSTGNDDHPPADMRDGQAFLSSIYAALAKSPQWSKSLLVITYDEHGGHYDHVPPPTTVDANPEFQQLGFRVPGLVIGPQVRHGCLNSTQFDHVSVIATLTKKYDLPPMNARVSATNDLSSCIDPALITNPRPPVEIPPYVAPTAPRAYRGSHKPHRSCFMNLERIVNERIGGDWRAEGRRSMQAVIDNGVRLGAIRLVDR